MTRIASANSLWIIEHVDAKQRFDSVGKEVRVSDNVLVKHALTAQWLASDLV